MKIEQKKNKFTPILITLENEFEARVLKTLVGHVGGVGVFRGVTDLIYSYVGDFGIESFDYDGNRFESEKVDCKS